MVFAKYLESPKYRIYIIAFIAAAFLLVLGIGAWFAYSYYVNKKEQAATVELAQIIEEYNKSSSLEDFKDLTEVITSVAKKHKNSKLYPFFVAYKSDLELKQNNEKEAIELLDNMLEELNIKDPLYYTYAIKKALLKLDSKINDFNNQGYSELKNLFNDVNNPLQDMAAYNLGLYELHKANKSKAKELFEIIVLKNRQASVWYSMAKNKLESL